MALGDFFRAARANANLKEIARQLRRIANALEEQNLVKGAPRGTAFHTLYEDPHSEEEAALAFPTDEYFAELERREILKRTQGGEAADLSDEDIEDLQG